MRRISLFVTMCLAAMTFAGCSSGTGLFDNTISRSLSTVINGQWNSDYNMFIDKTKTSFEYDGSGRLVRTVDKLQNGDDWVEKSQVDWAWNNNRLESMVTSDYAGSLMPARRVTATYDLNGNLDAITKAMVKENLLFSDTRSLSDFVDMEAYDIIYDDSGIPERIVYYSNSWERGDSYLISMDSNSRYESVTRYDSNGNLDYKYEYTYDSTGCLTELLSSQWSHNLWDPQKKEVWKYSEDGLLMEAYTYTDHPTFKHFSDHYVYDYDELGRVISIASRGSSDKLRSQAEITWTEKGTSQAWQGPWYLMTNVNYGGSLDYLLNRQYISLYSKSWAWAQEQEG